MRLLENVKGRLLGGQLALSSLFLVALMGGLVGGSSARLAGLAAVGIVATICLLLLTVARYESVVALGFLLFGVVLVQPALADLIFGIVILVAILTGRARSTLRRSPPLVVYALGLLIVLNVLAAAWAHSVGKAVFFLSITTYLALFGVWLAGYVDSKTRARRLVESVTIGATVIAILAIVALFVPFPGSAEFLYFHRAKGLFDDPNVFGPFMIVPFAFILAELVHPTLLAWRRRWLLVVLLVCGAGVLFSYSRATWLNTGLVVTTMIAAYALRRGGLRQATKTLGLGVAAVGALVAVLFLTGSTSFFATRAQLQYYDTSRFQGQDASFRLAREHLFGIGPGQYLDVVGIAAHSTFLRALGEEGVLGLALIVLLLLTTLILACGNVVRGRSTFGISPVPLLGLWVGLIANSFFVDTLHWRHLWLVAGLIWAGACVTEPRGARSVPSHHDGGRQAMRTRLLRPSGTRPLVTPPRISGVPHPESPR
jgi:O-antigen ligase